MSIKNFKSILITGASSGIGEALALAFAAPGVHVTITGRNQQRLDAIEAKASSRGADVKACAIDVTDRSGMTALIYDAESSNPFDLVIANAGISSGASGDIAPEEMIRDIFAVNLAGVINTVLPASNVMCARGNGHIAIVSSIAGLRGLPTAPAYSASKVAVKAWGEAIRPELREQGVDLSVIIPGFVESRITDANTFPMPWIMPAEKAADIIITGLKRGKPSIAFPWQMVWLMKIITSLPAPLFEWVLRRSPKKS